MRKEIKKYYEERENFIDYQNTAKKGLWKSEEKIIEKYKLFFPENIKILDLGCGTGRTTFSLNKIFPNAEIVAIDLVPKMIEFAKSINKTDKITFICDDILTHDFKDNKFDLILFSFNGFTHLLEREDINLFMNQIHHLLKDQNSKYIFTVYNMFSSKEYIDFWLNKKNVYSLALFDDQKILENNNARNRFYLKEDILEIANLHSFDVIESVERNEYEEYKWVLEISKPVIFYVFSKK